MLQMEIEEELSRQRSLVDKTQLSRMSFVNCEADDKSRHSIRGRRSSISVKQIVGNIELSEDIVLGDDMAKVKGTNSLFLLKKIACIDDEKKHFADYINKLKSESYRWDRLLQSWQTEANIAESDLEKPGMLRTKSVEEVRAEFLGNRDGPSPLEIALTMAHSLEKKTQAQVPRFKQLKVKVAVAEDKYRRLQEVIKVQEKFLNYESRDELLEQKAECDSVISGIEKWLAKHQILKRFTAV